MTSNQFGKYFRVTTFGESHGKAVGCVIDGVKPGIRISEKNIQRELDRRKPGQSKVTTLRKEEDQIHILSGIFNGITTGTPICMLVYNKNKDSSKYDSIKEMFRPGHADITFYKKYGIRDTRGGGRSSGRETIARVASAAIAKKELAKKKIKVISYVTQIGVIKAKKIDFKEIGKNPLRCPDKIAAKKMEENILSTKKKGDSLGGIVEIIVKNPPAGLGDPVFEKLDANLAKALMSIGAVKWVEIGSGFSAATKLGSENNDQLTPKGFKSNNSGGILGGISTGQDIIIRIAVKPTSSIAKEQDTIDIYGKPRKIKTIGMHDPCICPRIVPVAEAMVALVLYDALLAQEALKK